MTGDVAVVIPTYNRAALLARALASVRAQTVPAREVLVIDDGSTDDTADVCRAAGLPLRYERQANAGPSAARNLGARLAQAPWIAFLDSDDLWAPTKLAEQGAALAVAPAARWSLTSAELIGLDDRPVAGRGGLDRILPAFDEAGLATVAYLERFLAPAGAPDQRVWAGDAFEAFFDGNIALPSTAMVERAAFLASGGFDAALWQSEDMEFFHRLSAAHPMAFVDRPLTGYRVAQSGSLAGSANAARLIENGLANLRRGAALRPGVSARARAACDATEARWLRKLARTYVTDLRPRDARAVLRRLRAEHPARAGGLTMLELASWLPRPALALAARLKRGWRR